MQATDEAVRFAREGNGPSLVECKTYRWKGHSKSDAKKYRTREEEKQWRDRDPIRLMKERLIEAGHFTEDDAENIKKKRSEERRVGKERRERRTREQEKR